MQVGSVGMGHPRAHGQWGVSGSAVLRPCAVSLPVSLAVLGGCAGLSPGLMPPACPAVPDGLAVPILAGAGYF